MSDPYKVLEVSRDATDEEIKSAYRELVRKYHPDNYVNNPLSDLATEKMKEINEAYDTITKSRSSVSTSATGSSYSDYTNPNSKFSDIRRLIQSRRITEAEELLDGVPREKRDAEWFFLKGCVQQFRGWLDDALQNYAQACNMDPTNSEYKNAFASLDWQRKTASGNVYNTSNNAACACAACEACNICTTLACCDCLCNCCQ